MSDKEENVKLGFEQQTIELDLKNIVPLKILSQAVRESRKFNQIIASIKEVGIIQPIVVTKESASENRYILLDGHMRLEALKEIKETRTVCLIVLSNKEVTCYAVT